MIERASVEGDIRELAYVKLPIFEGPLDLLLYLIKKDELDIYDIPIESITRKYLDYLQIIKMLDLEVAGEYLVVAATLLYTKSRLLLPQEARLAEDEIEEHDPRWELVRQLVGYKKYKDAAALLQQRLLHQQKLIGRTVFQKSDAASDCALPLDRIELFDLLSVFQKVLARADRAESLRDIFEDRYTVSDKIIFIQALLVNNAELAFDKLFCPEASRTEVVVTFLALLELIRLRRVAVQQSGPFAPIVLRSVAVEILAQDPNLLTLMEDSSTIIT